MNTTNARNLPATSDSSYFVRHLLADASYPLPRYGEVHSVRLGTSTVRYTIKRVESEAVAGDGKPQARLTIYCQPIAP